MPTHHSPPPCPPTPLRLALQTAALSSALLVGATLSSTVQAQPPASAAATQQYDIPPGPLGSVLARFAAQSGLQIAADARITESLSSPGLRGSYPARMGLQLLLEGSGLTVQTGPNGLLTLHQTATAASSGAITLGPLRVVGVDAGQRAAPGVALHPSEAEAQAAVYSAAGSSVHISAQTLERFRGSSVGDMLKGQPGVQMADIRNGQSLDVNIRGIQGQGRVPVVIDGTQQALEVYRGYAGQQQRSYLDPDLIGGVDIEKGPGLSPDGAGAIGGVVRMNTLRAGDVLRPGQDNGLRLRLGLANNSITPRDGFLAIPRSEGSGLLSGDSYFASLAYARRSEKLDLVAAAVKRRQGNYFAGSQGAERYRQEGKGGGAGTGLSSAPVLANYYPNEEVLNTHAQSESLLLKATLRPDNHQALELGLRYMEARYGEIMPSAIARAPKPTSSVRYAHPEHTMFQFLPGSVKLTALSAQHRWQPAGQALIDLKSSLWYTRSDSLLYNAVAGAAPRFSDSNYMGDPQGESYARALRSQVRGERWGAQVGNQSHLFFGEGQELVLAYGLAHQREVSGAGPDSPRVEADLRNNRYVRSGIRQESSWVASMEWKPVERLSLQAGGRFSHFEVRDGNRRAHVTATAKVPRRTVELYKDGKRLFDEFVRWVPDAQGQFTEASLRSSPYLAGTVADHDFDSWKPFGRNMGLYQETIATAWRYEAPLRHSEGRFAPLFNAAYRFGDGGLVYAKYAEAVRMPGLFETTRGNHFAVTSADIKPEHSQSWELGASLSRKALFSAADRGGIKLAYFSNRVNDFITRKFDPSTFDYQVGNIARFDTAGWELQSQYDAGPYYGELSATYYTRARSCDAAYAKQLREDESAAYSGLSHMPDCINGGFSGGYTNTQNPPRLAVNTTLGLRLLQKRLETGTRLLYNSAPRHRLNQPWHLNASTALQQYYAASLIVDLFASYQLRPGSVLNLAVDNVGDRYYLDPLALSPMPAPGRTVRLDLSIKF